MSNQGFKALSKVRRTEVSRMGGHKAQALGVAHNFTSVEAAAASAKATVLRKRAAAKRAALKLMTAGFSPEQLDSLKLSVDELIYYGGSRMDKVRLIELAKRALEVNHGDV